MADYTAVIEFAHVLFGMMWVGVSIYLEVVLIPLLKKATTVAAYRQWLPVVGKTSQFMTISGILVLITGLVYLLVDSDHYVLSTILSGVPGLAVTPGQLIILSLAFVLTALIIGFGFLFPTAMKIVKAPWPEDPNAPLPEVVTANTRKLINGSLVNTGLVVVTLLFMVLAAKGGI